MATKIMKCSCKNTYQDSKYGSGMRLHNSRLDSAKSGYRCTVCSTVNMGRKE